MNRGKDEDFYDAQAEAFRAGGFLALRDLGAEYVEEPKLAAYPSPIRWLWIALLSTFPPIAQVASVLLVVAITLFAFGLGVSPFFALPLLVTSPLRQMLSQGKLQDTTVALATILALGAAYAGSPVLALALAVLLSLKEASVFSLPAIGAAWLLGGHPIGELAVLVLAGVSFSVASVLLIFGRDAFALIEALAAGHRTPYTLAEQRGAPHRLLVDLAAISPGPLLLALVAIPFAPALAAITAALFAAHALAPVRNVRLVLAGELLLRCLAAVALAQQPTTLAVPLLLVALAADLAIGRRTQNIYDPVTSVLTASLGMTKS